MIRFQFLTFHIRKLSSKRRSLSHCRGEIVFFAAIIAGCVIASKVPFRGRFVTMTSKGSPCISMRKSRCRGSMCEIVCMVRDSLDRDTLVILTYMLFCEVNVVCSGLSMLNI